MLSSKSSEWFEQVGSGHDQRRYQGRTNRKPRSIHDKAKECMKARWLGAHKLRAQTLDTPILHPMVA